MHTPVLLIDKAVTKNKLLCLTERGAPRKFRMRCWSWEGSEERLTEIKLKRGEPVERALRRLKKKTEREGTMKSVRSRRHYEKPSERRRRKQKAARFSAMLKARHADT